MVFTYREGVAVCSGHRDRVRGEGMAGSAEGAAKARAKLKQRQAEQQAAREAVLSVSIPTDKRGRPALRKINRGDGDSLVPVPGVHLVEPEAEQSQQSVSVSSDHQPSVITSDAGPDEQPSEPHQSLMEIPENIKEYRPDFPQQNPAVVSDLFNSAALEMGLVLIGIARARKSPAGVRMEAASRVLGLAGYVAPSAKDSKANDTQQQQTAGRLLPTVARILALRESSEGATDAELVPNQSQRSTG